MPGAVSGGVEGSSDTYRYAVKATTQEVKKYYLREMPVAGWELEDMTGDAGGDENSIRLRYRKGEEVVAIFIGDAGGGMVYVTIF